MIDLESVHKYRCQTSNTLKKSRLIICYGTLYPKVRPVAYQTRHRFGGAIG